MDKAIAAGPHGLEGGEGDPKFSPFQGPCHLQPTEAPDGPCQSSDGLQITHLVETEAALRCEACRVSLTRDLICPLCGADHSTACTRCRRRAYHLDGCRGQAEDRARDVAQRSHAFRGIQPVPAAGGESRT